MFVARGVARLERLARLCAPFCAGRAELLVLPPWDVMPYDPVAPTPGVIGRRVQTLARLSSPPDGSVPRLFLVSSGAALQRVPAPAAWATARLAFVPGEVLDRDAMRAALAERGYHVGEAAADPGDVAMREHVIDIFPAGAAHPARLSLDGDRISAIHALDVLSQRSGESMDLVEAFPAREFPLDPAQSGKDGAEDGGEALPLPSGRLVPVFDYARGFNLVVDAGVEARWAELREQIEEAHENSRRLRRAGGDPRGVLPPPERMFLRPAEAAAAIAGAEAESTAGTAEPAPARVAELVARVGTATVPVVVAAPTDPVKLARSLAKRGVPARAAIDWPDAVSGGVACCRMDIDGGFATEGVLVLSAAHLVRHEGATGVAALAGDHALRIGDIVVHAEHGAARLAGLKPFETDGERAERLALAFANETELLVDPLELDRIWRYGPEGAVDHLGGEAWRARRAVIEAEIETAAAELGRQAAARAKRRAPVIVPDAKQYDRLSVRFPHALSPDQRGAVAAVMADLRRGSPMNRLVCGDVGFGKTEVALRALAAVALSGFQAVLAAPTTVLARQHLETVRRRFAGTGVRVEGLISGADKAAVRRGLADGSIGIVVGTQAVAAPGLRFARLGLVVIDEEQRFGEVQKQALLQQDSDEGAVHALVMTATPIPHTMQAAMVGLRDASVIATAPVNRQATRTVVQPFDPAVLRDAVLREHARGGQSFVVCPRIADLAPLAATLAELAPELQVVQAHGRMAAEVLEAAVVGFAGGAGDVLLATNIIEAGLDIPRANTIAIMHPDRFGLAQLHQIRGRVGRGARRGTAYLMTDPGRQLPPATLVRLRVMETLSNLGAGIAISAADMDQRGAGELFGNAQAGHVSTLGTELYHHLLLRAVRAGQGQAHPKPPPVLHVGLHGRIPEDYVHDPDLRVALYRRLARLSELDAIEAFTEELTDRFGPPPRETDALLDLARLRCLGAAAGVRHLESGPRGVAIALHPHDSLAERLSEFAERLGGIVREDRLVVPFAQAPARHRVGELIALLATQGA